MYPVVCGCSVRLKQSRCNVQMILLTSQLIAFYSHQCFDHHQCLHRDKVKWCICPRLSSQPIKYLCLLSHMKQCSLQLLPPRADALGFILPCHTSLPRGWDSLPWMGLLALDGTADRFMLGYGGCGLLAWTQQGDHQDVSCRVRCRPKCQHTWETRDVRGRCGKG